MAIDPERWTVKTKEAFTAATQQASAAHHAEVTPAHLLMAVLGDPENISHPLLAKVGLDPSALTWRLGEQLAGLARAVGGSEPSLGRAAREGLEAADGIRRDMGDDYLSVEHLLLAFSDDLGVPRDQLLEALRGVRGSHRVTSPTPE
jgi:ATP-dependent Clp protease ATP-binding subunit ClpB